MVSPRPWLLSLLLTVASTSSSDNILRRFPNRRTVQGGVSGSGPFDDLLLVSPPHIQQQQQDETILGGTSVPSNTYLPELVIIDYLGTGCNGILFSDDIVVTTAFCAQSVGATFTDVRVGVQNRTVYDVATAETVAIHPCYSESEFLNDIGIIRLDTPVDGTTARPSTQTPFNLNNNLPAFNGRDLVMYGYGQTNETSNSFPDNLQSLVVQYLRTCKDALQGATYVFKAHLCIVYPPNSGPCAGDVGGPLFLCDASASCFLVGLLSFLSEQGGSVCGGDRPSGFVRLATYYEWILEQHCLYSASPMTTCDSRIFEPVDCTIDDDDNSGVDCGCACRAYRQVSAWASQVEHSITAFWWS